MNERYRSPKSDAPRWGPEIRPTSIKITSGFQGVPLLPQAAKMDPQGPKMEALGVLNDSFGTKIYASHSEITAVWRNDSQQANKRRDLETFRKSRNQTKTYQANNQGPWGIGEALQDIGPIFVDL